MKEDKMLEGNNKWIQKDLDKQRRFIERRYSNNDFEQFLAEILVNNSFSENETKIITHVLMVGFSNHKLQDVHLKVFKEAIDPFITTHCSNCLQVLKWVESASAHKRGHLCYICFSRNPHLLPDY